MDNKPAKILLWVVGRQFLFLAKALDTLCRQCNGLDMVGVASADMINVEYNSVPLRLIAENEIKDVEHDILLVTGDDKMSGRELAHRLEELQGDPSKILRDRITCIPGFALEKYRRLQRSRLTIFSPSCFGGIISHTLGLPFHTPLINMFFPDEDDYLRFLRCPRLYMDAPLRQEGTGYETNLKREYPICSLGNISIHMNHYHDFDEALEKWQERKAKINWYNLCAIMYTQSEKTLQEFDELPYGKKVCFVPFRSSLDSAFYLDLSIEENRPLWQVVNRYGVGTHFFYDPFDLLLYGKKTQLIDM